jgi:hypothetical protein
MRFQIAFGLLKRSRNELHPWHVDDDNSSFVAGCLPARAQTSSTEFLPEIDAYFKLNSDVRFVFQAKDTREGGDPTQVEIGPSIEFYLKPLIKLKDVTKFDYIRARET